MASSIPILEVVGERCLLTLAGAGYGMPSGRIDEYRVLEISPSQNFVRLQTVDGRKFWRSVAEIRLVEVLKDLKAGRPAG